MSPRRILFLDQYGDIGGGQTVLLSLLHAATKVSADVTLMAPGGGDLQSAVAVRFGSNVTFSACAEPTLTHGRKRLRDIWAVLAYGWNFRHHLQLLRQQDVIYVNGPRHLPHMLLLSLLMPAHMICHVHLDHSGPEKLLMRLAAHWPRRFQLIANSRFVAEALKVDSRRVTLIENALDQTFAEQGFRDRFGDGSRRWVTVVIGTLRPEKGQDIAAQAVAYLGDMTLHIIGRNGDGALGWIERLKAAAPAQVTIDGPATDLPQTLDALGAHFSIVPSRWEEPFGLVAIESMACSCITIVSGRGGLGEIAERTGALVARDAPELASVLARLCDMPAAALAILARQQFEATQRHYAPARFEAQVQTLLATAFAAPPTRL